MYSIISSHKNAVKKCVADFEVDLQTIPLTDFAPGSTVFVIESSKNYMLNHSKKWIEVELGSAGDITTPDTIIYSGGVV